MLHSKLKEILAEKHEEVARLKKRGLPDGGRLPGLEVRDFKNAISLGDGTGLIAEVKFASPSAGIISEKSDPIAIGRIYDDAGASAISLLTDKKFFGGSLKNLPPLKKAVSIPILRKDFIIDEIQVKESCMFGADAILLIARILSGPLLKQLLNTARTLGMAALTEVHDEIDLKKALDCGAEIIGINNRDLDTFEVNLQTTIDLAPQAPDTHVLVSESGIADGKDIRLLAKSGIQAVLVGTSIMKTDNMTKKIRELLEAGRKQDDKGKGLRYHKLSGCSHGCEAGG